MMTLKESLSYLEQYQMAGNHIHRESMAMAIDALKKQIWIPVSARLPKVEDEHGNSGDVLVVRQRYFNGKPIEGEVFMDVDYYNHDLSMWMSAPDPVIAWMPLPEPYKEGDTE